VVVLTTLLAGCQTERQPETAIPYPDLSSPCRFQPSVSAFAASPTALRIGEGATLTAEVIAAKSWTLAVAPGSLGDGTLTPKSGTGPLRAEFGAVQPGDVVIVASGENPDCGFRTVVQTTILVRP
jgi:hypothetical protein